MGMRNIDDELIQKIEKAFGFSLHDWQKAYIKDESDFISGGRGNGKTFAVCLKLLLTNEQTIKKSELRKFALGIKFRRKKLKNMFMKFFVSIRFWKKMGLRLCWRIENE